MIWSLLLKIKGDAAGGVKAATDTRAAIAQLRNQAGSDFSAMQNASQSALAGIGEHLNLFIGERIPLMGGAFVRVSENLRGQGKSPRKVKRSFAHLEKTIQGISTTTGKSTSINFLFPGHFVQLETQAKRDARAIEAFGAAAAQQLIP